VQYTADEQQIRVEVPTGREAPLAGRDARERVATDAVVVQVLPRWGLVVLRSRRLAELEPGAPSEFWVPLTRCGSRVPVGTVDL
jgi:hypothetical protein